MLCNIWIITIVIIITFIIGLILFSQSKTEQFESINNIPTQTTSLLDSSNTIMTNNDKINTLLNQLKNNNPKVQLINYNPETINLDMKNNISSNIATINNSLPALYNSKITNTSTNITQLEHLVTDLENIVNNIGLTNVTTAKYNTIKSLNNGLELKLHSIPNTTSKDNKTGLNIPNYMIMVNDGCLSVGANDYDIYKCNDKNPKQLFNMKHILNETAYQNNIDTSLPSDNINKSNINYPFVMMKSINNENCLTNNHGNLTVQPCFTFTAQRWFPL